jgi:hypothetical protein
MHPPARLAFDEKAAGVFTRRGQEMTAMTRSFLRIQNAKRPDPANDERKDSAVTRVLSKQHIVAKMQRFFRPSQALRELR